MSNQTNHGVIFVAFYSGPGFQIVGLFLNMCFQTYFTLGYVYSNADILTFSGFIYGLLGNLLYFFGACLLAILIAYSTVLHQQLGSYINMNEKLLDGMHEGLLIISKATK